MKVEPWVAVLPLALQYNLVGYVREKLAISPQIIKDKKYRPLLDYALVPPADVGYFRLSSELVLMLLKHGANPNRRYKGQSPWECALHWHNKSQHNHQVSETPLSRERQLERIKIFRHLLEYGANPNATETQLITEAKSEHQPQSAWSIITKSFIEDYPTETFELQELLKKRGINQGGSFLRHFKLLLQD